MPWHRRPGTSLTEPELRDAPRGPEKQENGAGLFQFESSDRPGSGYSLLDLIGGHGMATDGARHRRNIGAQATSSADNPEPEHTDDLVETLHAQYWRALTDPHTALSGSWGEQLDSPATPVASVTPDSHDVRPTPANPASASFES